MARIALVLALAFSLTLGAVAPIVANAQQMNEGEQETTQEMPNKRGSLAKITAVDGTHYTAEILSRHGHGGKDRPMPPTDFENDGELPERDFDSEEGRTTPSTDDLDDSERPERPERDFDSEDAGSGETDRLVPPTDDFADSARPELPEGNLGEKGHRMPPADGSDDSGRPELPEGDFEPKDGENLFKDFLPDELSEQDARAEDQTIEFNLEGKDFAVGDVVELTFGDDDTVTDAQKLDLGSMPEKKGARARCRKFEQKTDASEGDANQA